jgi:hypothetical protein
MEILILISWLTLCGVAAYVASNKGRSGMGVFFLAFFLSPLVGLIVAIAMSPDERKIAAAQGKKKCPNCAEFVQPDAKTCRYCQHSFASARKFCSSCGECNPADARYCQACGKAA